MDSQRLVLEVNRLIQTVEAQNGVNGLGMLARTILYFIADAEFEKRRLRVSDLTFNASFGSAPTVFSRLAELEKSGWISYRNDPDDRRIRLVMLTPTARRALVKMSKQLHQMLPASRTSS